MSNGVTLESLRWKLLGDLAVGDKRLSYAMELAEVRAENVFLKHQAPVPIDQESPAPEPIPFDSLEGVPVAQGPHPTAQPATVVPAQ